MSASTSASAPIPTPVSAGGAASATTTNAPPTALLPLNEWLKLLASRGVNMRVAMALAAKIHNTRQRLSELDNKKLTALVPNKDERKAVLGALKGIAEESLTPRAKKRNRDADLLAGMPSNQGEDDTPRSLDFNEITDPELLVPISITTNRAPLKTAWVYTVARRLGFDASEALSIAHVYVHISSLKHALALGNILNPRETREAEEELSELPGYRRVDAEMDSRARGAAGSGGSRGRGRAGQRDRGFERITNAKDETSSQPWVGILRAKPVIERTDGTWRAIEKGTAIAPSRAYLYITRAFKDYTPHIMGALQLVAESYEPDELNERGMGMYNDFKPRVEQWGQRDIVQCSAILECVKSGVSMAAGPGRAEPGSGTGTAGSSRSTLPKTIESSGVDVPVKRVQSGSGHGAEQSTDTDSELSDLPDSPLSLDPTVQDEAEGSKKRRIAVRPRAEAEQQEGAERDVGQQGKGSLEEYEAALDAELLGGGFMEGGDLFDMKR